jgi:hypothetical protein
VRLIRAACFVVGLFFGGLQLLLLFLLAVILGSNYVFEYLGPFFRAMLRHAFRIPHTHNTLHSWFAAYAFLYYTALISWSGFDLLLGTRFAITSVPLPRSIWVTSLIDIRKHEGQHRRCSATPRG